MQECYPSAHVKGRWVETRLEAGCPQRTLPSLVVSTGGGERKGSLCSPPRSQQALRTFAGSLRSRQDDGGRETACPGRAKTCSVDHTGALDIITIPRKSANLATFLCTVVGFYLLLSFPWTTSSLRAGPLLCGPNIWNRDSHP